MKKSELLHILAAHADALNRGEMPSAADLVDHGNEAVELLTLLALATRLKQVLVPLTPPAGFRRQLYYELMAGPPPNHNTRQSGARRLWLGMATVVGSLLSLGLLFWLRRQRSGPLPVG